MDFLLKDNSTRIEYNFKLTTRGIYKEGVCDFISPYIPQIVTGELCFSSICIDPFKENSDICITQLAMLEIDWLG